VEDALWSRGVRIAEFPLTPIRLAELLGYGPAKAHLPKD
jgi:hypothetical protein